jgi:hypothetical protein
VSTTTRRLAAIAAVTLALLLGAAAPARADNREEAEKLFRTGEAAFTAGNYVVAAQAFEEAYAQLSLPAIAFSTAQAYRLQYFVDKQPSRLKRAIDLYRLYVEQTPSGGRRDDAVASLAELEPILGRIEAEMQGTVQAQIITATTTQLVVTSNVEGATATIDGVSGKVPFVREVTPGEHEITVEAEGFFPRTQKSLAVEGRLLPIEMELTEQPAQVTVRSVGGARISIDGRPEGTTPLAGPLDVQAGRHFVTVSRRGRQPWAREITVARGEALALDAGLERTGQRKAAYVVLGAGALTGLGAGVAGLLALGADGKASDLEDKRQREGLTQEELRSYEKHKDSRDSRLTATWVLLGTAGVCALAGSMMMLFDNPSAEMAPMRSDDAKPAEKRGMPIAVTPVVSPDLAGLSVSGSF